MSEEALNRITKALDNTKFNLELPPGNPRILQDSKGRPYVLLVTPFDPNNPVKIGPSLPVMVVDAGYNKLNPARGAFVEALLTAPAAGANFTLAIPTAAYWKMSLLSIRFVTDANVATRQMQLLVTDSGNAFNAYQPALPPTQAASLTRDYMFISGHPTNETVFDANNVNRISISPELVLIPAQNVNLTVGTIQIGDAFSRMAMYRELWKSS